jgi:hypothetical protein
MPNSKNLIGRCGNYCGACEIYRAYVDKGKLLLEVAKTRNCLPADIRCDGCGALPVNGWARAEGWGRDCDIRKCLRGKGLEFCYDCTDILKCKRWNALAAEAGKAGIDLKASLLGLKQSKEVWLVQQAERWKCQKCGRPIAASEENRCHVCGAYQL